MILNRLLDDKIPKLRWCKRCKTLKTIYDFDKRMGKYINVCHSCMIPKHNKDDKKIHECNITYGLIYNTNIFKKCPGCGEIKNIDIDFRNQTRKIKDNLCVECRKHYEREYNKNKKQKLKSVVKIQTSSKKCSACGETKLIELFGNSNITTDGKTTQCKYCINLTNRTRRKNKTQDTQNISKEKAKHSREVVKNKRRNELEILDNSTNRLTEIFKICKNCNCNKQLKDFIVDWTCKDGRKNCCRDCVNKADRDRYATSEIKREKNSIKNKKYNKEKKKERTEYNNRPDVRARKSANRKTNITRRRKEDNQFNIIEKLRNSVRTNLKRYSKNGKVHKSEKYGLDYISIFNHIGPSPGDGYEIDHIIPCSVFPDLNIEGMIAMLYHPSNLQWLTKEKNMYKWNHIIPDMIREHNLEWICEIIGINLSEHEQNNYMLNIIKQEDKIL